MKRLGISLITLSVLVWIFYITMAFPNVVTESTPEIQVSSTRLLIIVSVLTALSVGGGVYLINKSKIYSENK